MKKSQYREYHNWQKNKVKERKSSFGYDKIMALLEGKGWSFKKDTNDEGRR